MTDTTQDLIAYARQRATDPGMGWLEQVAKRLEDTGTALRLVLHWTGWDELLANDFGDDLFDAGLLQVDPENDALCVLTSAGCEVVRAALAKKSTTEVQ